MGKKKVRPVMVLEDVLLWVVGVVVLHFPHPSIAVLAKTAVTSLCPCLQSSLVRHNPSEVSAEDVYYW